VPVVVWHAAEEPEAAATPRAVPVAAATAAYAI
jgi:hypothetical protein